MQLKVFFNRNYAFLDWHTTNITHLKTIVKPFRTRQFPLYVFFYDTIYKNVCTLTQKGQCGSILAMRAWHHILNFKNLLKHDQTICTKIAHHYPLSPGHEYVNTSTWFVCALLVLFLQELLQQQNKKTLPSTKGLMSLSKSCITKTKRGNR